MSSEIGAPPFDVVVIGGSQAGLAIGYHLAQGGLSFVILDAGPEIGHAWRSRWDSLTLFTPAQYSSLPGMAFPSPKDTYPVEGRRRLVPAVLRIGVRPSGSAQRQSHVTHRSVMASTWRRLRTRSSRRDTSSLRPVPSRFLSCHLWPATWTRRSCRSTAPTIEGRLNCPTVTCSSWEEVTPVSRSPKNSPRPGGGSRRGPASAFAPAAPARQGSLLVAVRDRIHEGQYRFTARSEVGETRRAHRIQREKVSALRRDHEEAVDERRGAARPLRRRKRARHRRHRLGDGVSTRFLLDRCPWCQGRERTDRPSTRGYRGSRACSSSGSPGSTPGGRRSSGS